ncbi:MAG: hypothetical protein ACR2IE_07540 [Candidatus Sumerlaeaceae bacterium]
MSEKCQNSTIYFVLGATILLFQCGAAGAQEVEAENPPGAVIRITATPAGMARKHRQDLGAAPQPAPQNGGAPQPDEFLDKYNSLFGAAGKLRPRKTPQIVTDDTRTSAQRVAEMIREMRARQTPRPRGPDWVRDATPSTRGYVAPTAHPSARVATPAPKSNLPSIDLGGDGSSSYR